MEPSWWISLAKDAPLAFVFMGAIWLHYRGLGNKLDSNTEAFNQYLAAQGESRARAQQCVAVAEKLERACVILQATMEAQDTRSVKINERELRLDKKAASRT